MKNISIAFDLDGTILNTGLRHQKVLHDCLRLCDINIKFEEIGDYLDFKKNGKNTLAYLKKKGINRAEEVFELWKEKIEEDNYLKLDTLFRDSIAVLDYLSSKYDLYLVTARKSRNSAIKQVNDLNLSKYFKDIYIVTPGKNVDIRKYEMTIKKDIKYVFGDTEIDFSWAIKLNAQFIPVAYGFRSPQWWNNRAITTYENLIIAVKELEL